MCKSRKGLKKGEQRVDVHLFWMEGSGRAGEEERCSYRGIYGAVVGWLWGLEDGSI